MRVAYSRRSLRQLEAIHTYISARNPRAAHEVVARIEELCTQPGDFPGIGNETDQLGVMMLPVVRYPYNILYKMLPDRDEVRNLRVRHGARLARQLSKGEIDG